MSSTFPPVGPYGYRTTTTTDPDNTNYDDIVIIVLGVAVVFVVLVMTYYISNQLKWLKQLPLPLPDLHTQKEVASFPVIFALHLPARSPLHVAWFTLLLQFFFLGKKRGGEAHMRKEPGPPVLECICVVLVRVGCRQSFCTAHNLRGAWRRDARFSLIIIDQSILCVRLCCCKGGGQIALAGNARRVILDSHGANVPEWGYVISGVLRFKYPLLYFPLELILGKDSLPPLHLLLCYQHLTIHTLHTCTHLRTSPR